VYLVPAVFFPALYRSTPRSAAREPFFRSFFGPLPPFQDIRYASTVVVLGDLTSRFRHFFDRDLSCCFLAISFRKLSVSPPPPCWGSPGPSDRPYDLFCFQSAPPRRALVLADLEKIYLLNASPFLRLRSTKSYTFVNVYTNDSVRMSSLCCFHFLNSSMVCARCSDVNASQLPSFTVFTVPVLTPPQSHDWSMPPFSDHVLFPPGAPPPKILQGWTCLPRDNFFRSIPTRFPLPLFDVFLRLRPQNILASPSPAVIWA